jgi:hypothetical protein
MRNSFCFIQLAMMFNSGLQISSVKFFFILILVTTTTTISAQQSRSALLWQFVNETPANEFLPVSFFDDETSRYSDSLITDAFLLSLRNQPSMQLYSNPSVALLLQLPAIAGSGFTLRLKRCMNARDGLPQIGTMGSFAGKSEKAGGIHYRGVIAGDSNSIAAISLYEDGTIMGLFAGKSGNWVLGNNKQQYVLYASQFAQLPAAKGCGADDEKYSALANNALHADVQRLLSTPTTLCRKIRMYWEADYNLYRYSFNGNLTATRNYLIGVFNMVAALFQNEGIVVELAEANIWLELDPYRNNSSNNALDDFKQFWNNLGNNFNGDIAHLVCGGPVNNGGIAYLNVLCNKQFAYGYSNVFGQYNTFPAFSFDVEILAHEIGHNMGSQHTHWCGWNTGAGGTCGAIDNCGTVEATTTCPTCPSVNVTSAPGWSGTVMSYCYVVNNIGVNFSNGFGPLPQAVIRNAVNTGACLSTNNTWTGTTDTLWAKSSNWGCGSIPVATTDVVIAAPVPHLPVVTGSATCRSLSLRPGTSVKVLSPAALQITGRRAANLVSPPASQSLYITGTATPAGWMANGDLPIKAQQFYPLTSALYIINGLPLNGGGALAFVPRYGQLGSRYGFAGAGLTNSATGDAFVAGGNDLRGPVDTGNYRILVDFQRGQYSLFAAQPLVPLPSTAALYITGSATPAGWMSNGDAPVLTQKFNRISNTLYTLPSLFLTAGASFLFVPVYGNWSDKYGGMGFFNNSNTTNGDYFQQYGSDLLTVPVSGNYQIVVDFLTGRYQLIAL